MNLYLYAAFNWVNQYVDVLQDFIASKAVLAPLLLLFIEEAGIPLPVPGDMLIAYTGYRISLHPHGPGLVQAFFAAQVAALAGSTVLFFLSRRWGQAMVIKLGKFVFLKEEHIRRAEHFFARYGILTIIIGRHIPGLRIPVTIFAATSGIRYLTFLGSTFVSTSIWIVVFLLTGERIGHAFRMEAQRYTGLTVLVISAVVIGFTTVHVIGMIRERRAERAKLQE